MDGESDQDRQMLLAQLDRASKKLDGLARDLGAIDGEIEGLSTERKQHRLLHEVCGGLAELRTLGGAELFWGDRASGASGEELLRRARGRVDAFEKRWSELEDRREALLDEIHQQQDVTDRIEEDVFEAQEEEERRLAEWIIDREISVLPGREMVMPWTHGGEDDARFRKSFRATVAVYLLLMIVTSVVDLPLREPDPQPIEVPERLVRLMIQSRPLPPPPPREEARPEAIEPPKQQQVAQESAPERSKPSEGPGKGSGEGPGEGPGKGVAKGILAFREKFSGVTETQSVARLGSQARITGDGTTGPAQRSMVTTQAPGSSGGINLASLSRGVGGGGGSGAGGRIAGVQIARATSAIAAGGGGGGAGRSAGGAGALLGRTDEEIQIVFDRHKSALYRLYNRELRRDPTLKGQMILRMTIEPDGSVSLCMLQGSDMNAPQLATQVVDRVRTFDFGAKEGIAAVTILYPIDFLPAV